MKSIFQVILESGLAVVVLFIISKILGKKQVAQLEFIDYAIGISIGSIAAEMAFDTEVPKINFIVAMLVFGGLDLFLTLISRKADFLKSAIKGRPLMIIENGSINYKNLKKSKLDIYELVAQCRTQGYFYLDDIAFCIFEANGDFSILPKFASQPAAKEDLQIKPEEAALYKQLVVDGKIIYDGLNSLNKDVDWLLEKLSLQAISEVKNILYATYDEAEKKVRIYPKN